MGNSSPSRIIAATLCLTVLLGATPPQRSSKDIFAEAYAWLVVGDISASRELFTAGISIDPNDPLAWMYKADSEVRLGMNDEAKASYARALSLAVSDQQKAMINSHALSLNEPFYDILPGDVHPSDEFKTYIASTPWLKDEFSGKVYNVQGKKIFYGYDPSSGPCPSMTPPLNEKRSINFSFEEKFYTKISSPIFYSETEYTTKFCRNGKIDINSNFQKKWNEGSSSTPWSKGAIAKRCNGEKCLKEWRVDGARATRSGSLVAPGGRLEESGWNGGGHVRTRCKSLSDRPNFTKGIEISCVVLVTYSAGKSLSPSTMFWHTNNPSAASVLNMTNGGLGPIAPVESFSGSIDNVGDAATIVQTYLPDKMADSNIINTGSRLEYVVKRVR